MTKQSLTQRLDLLFNSLNDFEVGAAEVGFRDIVAPGAAIHFTHPF